MSVCNISAKLGKRDPVGHDYNIVTDADMNTVVISANMCCTINIDNVCSGDLNIVVNVALEILKRKLAAGATAIIKIVSDGNPMVYRFVSLDSSSILITAMNPNTNVLRDADLTSSYIRVVNNVYSAALNSNVSAIGYIVFKGNASASLMRYRPLSVGYQAMDTFDFVDIDQLTLGQCDIVEVM